MVRSQMTRVIAVGKRKGGMDVQRICTYIAPFANSHPCGIQRGVEIVGSLVEW